jgi:hypothetical protein
MPGGKAYAFGSGNAWFRSQVVAVCAKGHAQYHLDQAHARRVIRTSGAPDHCRTLNDAAPLAIDWSSSEHVSGWPTEVAGVAVNGTYASRSNTSSGTDYEICNGRAQTWAKGPLAHLTWRRCRGQPRVNRCFNLVRAGSCSFAVRWMKGHYYARSSLALNCLSVLSGLSHAWDYC